MWALLVFFTVSSLLTLPAQADEVLELPHRRGPITLDGQLDDWQGPRLTVVLAEPEVPVPLANQGEFHLVWDEQTLWFAAVITDGEVYAAPAATVGSALYQWDSIEIYVDGQADREPRMDEDDLQLIVACDGRQGAMSGDRLLRTVEEWMVPKRERPGVGSRAASRRTDDGYVLEGAVPLAAVGLAQARAGQRLALDLAWNDWIEDHPRLPELLKDLENLALLSTRMSESEVAIVDPDSLGWDGLLAWEDRAYRPWSWASGRDFGHPASWRVVQLVGQPSLSERLARRWGALRLMGLVVLVALALSLSADLLLRRRQRRRIRELAARVEELQAAAVPMSQPSAAEERPWVEKVADRLDGTGAEPGRDLAGRLVAHVRENLTRSLTVAEVARDLGMSTRTLQRACQQELDASPRDVILAVKMGAARELLATGRWRVGEVAEQVGFDSPYHFSRRFKDFHGRPPSAFISH